MLRACVGSNIIERDFFYDKNFERKTNVLTCVNLIATKKWTPSPPPCAPITAASKLKKTSFCHQKKEKNFLNQNFLQTVAWFWLFPKNFVTKIIQLYGERKKRSMPSPLRRNWDLLYSGKKSGRTFVQSKKCRFVGELSFLLQRSIVRQHFVPSETLSELIFFRVRSEVILCWETTLIPSLP